MSVLMDVEQRSGEWLRLRCAVVTSSNFDKIITPATGKASSQAIGYRRALLSEWITGKPSGIPAFGWMERGQDLEAEARRCYEFECDVDVQETGLIYLDDRKLIGCSPDALVDDDGGLEMKCPAPHTHVGYLIDAKLPTAYISQVQGAMWVTGRQWWDFMSYHPEMEPLIVRVKRDEGYIAKMATLIEAFVATMLEERQILLSRGLGPKQ